jgi:hypothetical protein
MNVASCFEYALREDTNALAALSCISLSVNKNPRMVCINAVAAGSRTGGRSVVARFSSKYDSRASGILRTLRNSM